MTSNWYRASLFIMLWAKHHAVKPVTIMMIVFENEIAFLSLLSYKLSGIHLGQQGWRATPAVERELTKHSRSSIWVKMSELPSYGEMAAEKLKERSKRHLEVSLRILYHILQTTQKSWMDLSGHFILTSKMLCIKYIKFLTLTGVLLKT